MCLDKKETNKTGIFQKKLKINPKARTGTLEAQLLWNCLPVLADLK